MSLLAEIWIYDCHTKRHAQTRIAETICLSRGHAGVSLRPVCAPGNSLKIKPPAIVTPLTCLDVSLSMWHHTTLLCPTSIPRQPTQSKWQPTCPRTLKQHCAIDTCSNKLFFSMPGLMPTSPTTMLSCLQQSGMPDFSLSNRHRPSWLAAVV